MKNNLVELTQELISIASYVDSDVNESTIADYIVNYLRENIPWLKVEIQKVESRRYNIIAGNNINPKLVFVSHMDTVLTNDSGMLKPRVEAGKIYGLGACDMKGGLAAALCAAAESGPNENLCLIFDCDEEYYFKGINKILEKYKFSPKLVVCPEPTDLKIENGCRGVIEIQFEALGKSAHAGTPQAGVNAIIETVEIVKKLRQEFSKAGSPQLGNSTVNLSYVNGGKFQDGEVKIQANAVADFAKVLLDIRPSDPKLNAKKVFELIEKFAKEANIKVQNAKINLDYQAYYTDRSLLNITENIQEKVLNKVIYKENLSNGGFSESALVSKAWNCPAISFGPALGAKSHMKDEYVDIESLEKTKSIFGELIKSF